MTDRRPDDDRERREFLRIYLTDHLAGSTAGTRRARRLADAERDGPDGRQLRIIADEIAADRQSLETLIAELDVPPRRYKQALARVGEFVGLVKLNGRLFRRSPLSTLVEIETLLIATRGKQAGFETVRTVVGQSRVGPIDLDDLIERSRRHHATLAELHEAARARVLA